MSVPVDRSSHGRRGRPRARGDKRRHNRVVTFVTDSELERLEWLASVHDRSLSAIVHRMIVEQLQHGEDADRERC